MSFFFANSQHFHFFCLFRNEIPLLLLLTLLLLLLLLLFLSDHVCHGSDLNLMNNWFPKIMLSRAQHSKHKQFQFFWTISAFVFVASVALAIRTAFDVAKGRSAGFDLKKADV
jgi:hypothetical protein